MRFAASRGTPHTDIASLIGCSKGTLRKHFAWELKLGKAEANLRVAEKLYNTAMGDPTLPTTLMAAIFWAKCQMGWKATARADSASEANANAAAVSQVVIVRFQDAAKSSRNQAVVADAA